MDAQFLPAKSCGLTKGKNSLRVVQNYPEIIGAVNYENIAVPCCATWFYKKSVTRRGNTTYEIFTGQSGMPSRLAAVQKNH